MPPAQATAEAARLQALQSYAILDTPAEESFDQLAKLAAQVCHCSMAVVNFVDHERQWFKATVGVPFRETDRAIAFCAHALSGSREPRVVPDARLDPSFAHNPLVLEEPHVRFYACVPLVTNEGFALGTLAVLDSVPRSLSPEQLEGLRQRSLDIALVSEPPTDDDPDLLSFQVLDEPMLLALPFLLALNQVNYVFLKNPLSMFELVFLNNLLDLLVKQNVKYNLIYLEHEQI